MKRSGSSLKRTSAMPSLGDQRDRRALAPSSSIRGNHRGRRRARPRNIRGEHQRHRPLRSGYKDDLVALSKSIRALAASSEPRQLGGPHKDRHPNRASPLRLGTAAESDAKVSSSSRQATILSLGWACPSWPVDACSASWPSRASSRSILPRRTACHLITFSTGMGVALKNARLFDETKRLSSRPTSAPPSWRSSIVSRGSRSEARHAGDVRPRRRQDPEIFDVDGVDIERYDARTGMVTFEYTVERGQALPADPISLIGFRRQVVRVPRAGPD